MDIVKAFLNLTADIDIYIGISVRVNLHQEMDVSFAGNAPSLAGPPLYPGPCFDLIT